MVDGKEDEGSFQILVTFYVLIWMAVKLMFHFVIIEVCKVMSIILLYIHYIFKTTFICFSIK